MTKKTGEPNQSPTSASNYVESVYDKLLKKAGLKRTHYGFKKISVPVKREQTLHEYQQSQRNKGEAESWQKTHREQRTKALERLHKKI